MNRPQTPDGIAAWAVFENCVGQLRYAIGIVAGKPVSVPSGLDYAAVLSYAREVGAISPLLLELLPEIEAIIVRADRREDE